MFRISLKRGYQQAVLLKEEVVVVDRKEDVE